MKIFYNLLLATCLILSACGRTYNADNNDKKIDTGSESHVGNLNQPLPDTDTIAILPMDTSYGSLFNAARTFVPTNKDLRDVDALLEKSIEGYNVSIDTSKHLSDHIFLKNYKRQYVPFIDSSGQRKVYVSCFCDDMSSSFKYWKHNLIWVADGGSCFFNLTINLSKHRGEQLMVNGYA